jgi:hypothetical protein
MKRKLWRRLLSVAIACAMMVTYTVPSFAEDDIGGAPGTSQTEQTDTGETEGETGGDTETDINTEGGNITIEGDTETPPAEGDTETPPAEGDTETPPAEGDTETPPAEGDTETPPAEGDTETPPAEETPAEEPPAEETPVEETIDVSFNAEAGDLPYDAQDTAVFVELYNLTDDGTTGITGWLANDPSTWTGDGLPVITWTAIDTNEDTEPDKYNVTSFTDNTGTLAGAVSLRDLWEITAIDISGNSQVTELDIQGNGDLTSIDVTGTSLTHISLGANRSMTDYSWVNSITTLEYLSAWDITFDFKETFATAIATIIEHRGSVSYDGAEPFWYQYYPAGKPYLDVAVWGNGINGTGGQWVWVVSDENGADNGPIATNTALLDADGAPIADGYLPGDGNYSVTYDISDWKTDPGNANFQTLLNQVHVNIYGMYDGLVLAPTHIYLYSGDTSVWDAGYSHEIGVDRNADPEILEALAYGYDTGWSEGIETARPAADLVWDKVKVDFTVTGYDNALGYASGSGIEEEGRGIRAEIDVLKPSDPAFTTPFVGLEFANIANVAGARLTIEPVTSDSGTVYGNIYAGINSGKSGVDQTLTSSGGKLTWQYTEAIYDYANENHDLSLVVPAYNGTRFLITKAELLNTSGAVISSTDPSQATQTCLGYAYNTSDVEDIITLYGLTADPNSRGWTSDPLTWVSDELIQIEWTPVEADKEFILTKINDNSSILTGAVTFPAFENLEYLSVGEHWEGSERITPESNITSFTIANLLELTDLRISSNKKIQTITLTNLPKLETVYVNHSSITDLNWLTGITTLKYLSALGVGNDTTGITVFEGYAEVCRIIERNRGTIDGNGVQPFWYQYVEAERPYITFINGSGPNVGATDLEIIEQNTELYTQVDWKDDLEREWSNQITQNGRHRLRLNNVDGNGLDQLKIAIRGMYKDFTMVPREFRLFNGSQLVYTSPAYEAENWSWYPYPLVEADGVNEPGNPNYGYWETVVFAEGYDNLPAEGRPSGTLKWNAVEVDFEVYNYHANLDYASGEGIDKPGRGSPTDLSLYPVTAFNDQWPGDSTYDVGSPFGGMTYDKVSDVTGIRIYTSPVLKDASGNVNLRLDYAVENSVGSTLYTPYGQSAEGAALTEANEYIYEYTSDTPIFTGATASDNVHILINATQFTRFDVMKIELLDADDNVIATADADDNNPNVTVDHGPQVFIPNKPVLSVSDYARNPVIGPVTDTNNNSIWDETDKIMSGYVQNENIAGTDYYYDNQMLNNGEYKIKYDFNKAKTAGAIEALPIGFSAIHLGIVGYDNAEINYRYIKINGTEVLADNPTGWYWLGNDGGTPHYRESGIVYPDPETNELTGMIAGVAEAYKSTPIETIEIGFFLKGLPQSLGTYIPGGDQRRMVVYDNVGDPGWQEGESFIGVENNYGPTTPLTYETAKDITGFHFNIKPLYTDTSDGSLTVYADVIYNDNGQDPRNYTMEYTLDPGTVAGSMQDGWVPTAHIWPESGPIFKDMTASDTLVDIRFYGDGAYAIDSFRIFGDPIPEGGHHILTRHEAYVNEEQQTIESPYDLGAIGEYGYQYTGNRIEEVFNNNAVIDGNNDERSYELNVGALIENSYLKQDGISPSDIYGFEIDVRPAHSGGNNIEMRFTTTRNDPANNYNSFYSLDTFAFRQPQYFKLLDADWPIFDDENAIFYAGTDDGDAYHIMGLRFLAQDGSTIFGMGTLDSWRGVQYRLLNQNGNYLEMTSSINTATIDLDGTGIDPADVYGVKVHYSPWYHDNTNTITQDFNPIVAFQLEAATWTDGGSGDVRDGTYFLGTWGTEDENADDGRTGETRLSDYYSAANAPNKFSPVPRDGTTDKYDWWGDITIDNGGQPLFPAASIGTGKHNKLYFRNDSELYGGFTDFALIGADGEILWWYGGHFGPQQNPNPPETDLSNTFFPLTPFLIITDGEGEGVIGRYAVENGDIWAAKNLYEEIYSSDIDDSNMRTINANGEYSVRLDLEKAVEADIIAELPTGLRNAELSMIGLDSAEFSIKYIKVNDIVVAERNGQYAHYYSFPTEGHGVQTGTIWYNGDTQQMETFGYLDMDLSQIEGQEIKNVEIGYWVKGFEEEPMFHAPYSGASSKYVLYDVSDAENPRGPFFRVVNGETIALPNQHVTDVYGIEFAISPRYSVMPDGSQTIRVGLVKNDDWSGGVGWGDPNQVQDITLTAEDISNIHNQGGLYWYTFKRQDGQPLVSSMTDLESLKFFFQNADENGSEGAFTIYTVRLLTADGNDEDTELDSLVRTEVNETDDFYDLGELGRVGWANDGLVEVFTPSPEIPYSHGDKNLNVPIDHFFSQTRNHTNIADTPVYGYEVDIRPVFGTNWDVSGDIVTNNGDQEITCETFNIQAAGHGELAPMQYFRYTYSTPIFTSSEDPHFAIYAHEGDYFKVAGVRFLDENGNVIFGSGTLDSYRGDEYNMNAMGDDGATEFPAPLINVARLDLREALDGTSYDPTDVYGVKFIIEPYICPPDGVYHGFVDMDDDGEDDDGRVDWDPVITNGVYATVNGDLDGATAGGAFIGNIGNGARYTDLLVTSGSTFYENREQNKLYIVEFDPENRPNEYTTRGEFTLTKGGDPFFNSYDETQSYDIQYHRWGDVAANINAVALLNADGEIIYSTGWERNEFTAGVPDEPGDADATVTIDNTHARPGTTKAIKFSISENSNLMTLEAEIHYDPAYLTPVVNSVSTANTVLKGSPVINIPVENSGVIYVSYAVASPVTDAGVMFAISFTVNEGAEAGTTQITMQTTTESTKLDPNGDNQTDTVNMIINYLSGSIDSATLVGDVNNSGSVTATDALWILQSTARLRTLTEEQAAVADVNSSNSVTATDALWILQYTARLRPSL